MKWWDTCKRSLYTNRLRPLWCWEVQVGNTAAIEVDNGKSCKNCTRRNKHSGCKHVMCKTFGTNQPCTNRNCTFACGDDEFTALMLFTLLKQEKGGPSPIQTKAAEEMNASGKSVEGVKTGDV
jgi:hypothetical protein